MIIVLDSNIWISELALMSPIGCAFNHYLTVNGYKIGLPEVIEEEVKHNFRENLKTWRSDIEKSYIKMLAILGKMKELVLPSDEEIELRVQSIFDIHKDRIIKIPFDFESARSALNKIIKKLPPNSDNKEQFKDSVIWSNCLKLAESDDVIFVTKDTDFFEERKYSKGLAKNLDKEAQNMPHKISICNELSDLLKKIKIDLPLKEDYLVELIESQILDKVTEISERNQFIIKKLSSKKIEIFATNNPYEIAIRFFLKYELENRAEEPRLFPYAESKGEFLLNIENYNISNFTNHGERVVWKNEDGEEKDVNIFYGYLETIIGHKITEHTIKYKLGER